MHGKGASSTKHARIRETTCKLMIKTLLHATYVYANEQLRVCFYVLIRYSLLFSSEIILKQLFATGSVKIVE